MALPELIIALYSNSVFERDVKSVQFIIAGKRSRVFEFSTDYTDLYSFCCDVPDGVSRYAVDFKTETAYICIDEPQDTEFYRHIIADS